MPGGDRSQGEQSDATGRDAREMSCFLSRGRSGPEASPRGQFKQGKIGPGPEVDRRTKKKSPISRAGSGAISLKSNEKGMVGARGFEPPTPCSRSRCATRLRYAPTLFSSHNRGGFYHPCGKKARGFWSIETQKNRAGLLRSVVAEQGAAYRALKPYQKVMRRKSPLHLSPVYWLTPGTSKSRQDP